MKSVYKTPQAHFDSNWYLDRDISLLEFNRRVLAQAEDKDLPIMERLRYLCIATSNLDEFFEVRVSSLQAKSSEEISNDTEDINKRLHRISVACHKLVEEQYTILNEEVLPALADKGIYLLQKKDQNEAQQDWIRSYFENQIRPILTPIVLDPAHPFPQVANKSLNFIVMLAGKDAFGRGSAIAIVKAPRILPRVIPIPQELSDKGMSFCLLTSIIDAHISDLFPQRAVLAHSQFRITRDSDLWVDEEEVKNLREALKSGLQSRHYGEIVRLEVARDCPENLASFLLGQFSLDQDNLYRVDGPVNMVRLLEMFDYIKAPEFYFPPYRPSLSVNPLIKSDLFKILQKRDVLLHHPFQSFQTVTDFIHTAANDPKVIVIKQTIYRAGMTSDLMDALIHAARQGKEVITIVELKARFDEEQNIDWAQRLEQAGAQVVYGVMGLKTHAKLALVIRREDNELKYYAHMGTGNYHSNTTKTYTDFGLLTANPAINSEINEIFIHLTGLTKPKNLSYLWLAPFALHNEINKAILNEVRIARQGRKARIISKMNSLIDESVIRALYEASQAGVKIDLIIRGACALRPGVPGLSDNIRVRSIVGRFLEHERIYYFRNDLKHDLYLSSADWMARNLFRRIEVAFPILDKSLKRRIMQEGLSAYLKDNSNAWELQSDGTYKKRLLRRKQLQFGAQQHLMLTYSDSVMISTENSH